MKNVRFKVPPTKKTHPIKSGKETMFIYRTGDLYLSSFLKTRGLILAGVEKENNRIIFVFKGDKENIKKLINEYLNDSGVGVLSYKAALRDLRSIIFNYEDSKIEEENRFG